MKKLLKSILLVAIVAVATPVFSQNNGQYEKGESGGGKGQGHQPDYDKLKTDLSLTDAQVSSWKSLDQKYKAKKDALRSNTTLNETDKRTQHKQLRDAQDAELKTILSESQYATFQKNRPQRP